MRLALRLLKQLLQQLLQKCNSRESASASRHTKLSKVAKVPRFRRCPSRFGSSPPFNNGRLPSPPRPPTQPYPTRPRVVALSRSPRRFSCLSPAVLTARCHATPSPPSLRSLPPNCRAWVSNCRVRLSKCRVRFLKCRAWAGATAVLVRVSRLKSKVLPAPPTVADRAASCSAALQSESAALGFLTAAPCQSAAFGF